MAEHWFRFQWVSQPTHRMSVRAKPETARSTSDTASIPYRKHGCLAAPADQITVRGPFANRTDRSPAPRRPHPRGKDFNGIADNV